MLTPAPATWPVLPDAPGEPSPCDELATATLEDLGDVLPHGLAVDGQLERAFVLRRPTMGLQKQVGGLRADATLAKRPGALYLRFLGLVVEQLGTQRLGDLKPGVADELLGRLTIGDVLFLGYAWQRACAPRGLSLGQVDCGGCGSPLGDVRVDPGSLEVTHLPVAQLRPPETALRLYDPIPVGTRTVVALRLRPPLWGVAYGRIGPESFANPAAVQARAFVSAVSAALCADGTEIPGLTEAALDELMPDDVRAIDAALGALTPTLDLAVEVECPACGKLNRDTLDWRSPGFSRPS